MINRLRHTDWLAVGFYPLAVVLMEAFWVSPWLAWLGGWPVFPAPRPVLGLGPVVFTLAVSLLVTRVVTRQKWPVRLAQAAIIGAGLVAILLVLGLEYRAGYAFLRKDEKTDEMSFVKRIGGGDYPRFHIYVKMIGYTKAEINLHLDQKKTSYEGSTAHSGEYANESWVAREVEIIKQAFEK